MRRLVITKYLKVSRRKYLKYYIQRLRVKQLAVSFFIIFQKMLFVVQFFIFFWLKFLK